MRREHSLALARGDLRRLESNQCCQLAGAAGAAVDPVCSPCLTENRSSRELIVPRQGRLYTSPDMSATVRRVASIDRLLETPPTEIVADLQALRDERLLIERKEAMLEQTLAIIAEQGGDAAERVAELRASAGVGSLREQIRQVVATKRTEGTYTVAVVPKEVLNALLERGNRDVKLDNIRVTMKRMFDSKELERPIAKYAQIYAIPGTADEFPDEVQALVEMVEKGLSK